MMALLPSLALGVGLALQLPQGVPTVGDTVWAVRVVKVRAGAVLRPAPWPDDVDQPVQSLGAPKLERRGDSVAIRYPLVVWTAGEHPIEIPGPVLLGPGAAVDSLPAEATTLFIESVIPDSVNVDSARVQPAALTVATGERSWWTLLEFALVGALLAYLALRLRRHRTLPAVPVSAPTPPAPDVVRWAGNGELRAAQAGARARLRRSVAGAVPAAEESLDIAGCLAALRAARPEWPLLELEGLLFALDAERFAPDQGDPDLVERADALRVRLERAG